MLAAIERIPRESFVPEAFHDQAYEDKALPIGQGQTICAKVVALMTQAMDLIAAHKVLEIGTGSRPASPAVLARAFEALLHTPIERRCRWRRGRAPASPRCASTILPPSPATA